MAAGGTRGSGFTRGGDGWLDRTLDAGATAERAGLGSSDGFDGGNLETGDECERERRN